MVGAGRTTTALRCTLLLLFLAACDEVTPGPDYQGTLETLYLMRPDRPLLVLPGPIVFTDSTGSYTLTEGEVRLSPWSSIRGQATREWRFVHSPSDSTIEVVMTVTYEREGNTLQVYDAAGRPFRVWTLAPDGRLLMEDTYCSPIANVCVEWAQIYMYDPTPLPLTPYQP